MLEGLKHAHSGLRWLVLIFLLLAIGNAFMKWRNGSSYEAGDKKISLFAMTLVHIQILIGFALYFMSNKVTFEEGFMKDAFTRFYAVEHIAMMVLATLLITLGYSKAKRTLEDTAKFKTTFIFYLIGLVMILAAIPWPFRALGGAWF